MERPALPADRRGTTLAFVEFGTIADSFTVSGTTYTSTKAVGATWSRIWRR